MQVLCFWLNLNARAYLFCNWALILIAFIRSLPIQPRVSLKWNILVPLLFCAIQGKVDFRVSNFRLTSSSRIFLLAHKLRINEVFWFLFYWSGRSFESLCCNHCLHLSQRIIKPCLFELHLKMVHLPNLHSSNEASCVPLYRDGRLQYKHLDVATLFSKISNLFLHEAFVLLHFKLHTFFLLFKMAQKLPMLFVVGHHFLRFGDWYFWRLLIEVTWGRWHYLVWVEWVAFCTWSLPVAGSAAFNGLQASSRRCLSWTTTRRKWFAFAFAGGACCASTIWMTIDWIFFKAGWLLLAHTRSLPRVWSFFATICWRKVLVS